MYLDQIMKQILICFITVLLQHSKNIDYFVSFGNKLSDKISVDTFLLSIM